MSLSEVYLAAYQAQKRFNQESARSNGSLRIMVGHLAHFTSLRQRIEYLNAQEASRRIQFSQDNIHPCFRTSPVALQPRRRKSPPPPPPQDDGEDSDEDDANEEQASDDDDIFEYEDDEAGDLGLTRFKSNDSSPELDAWDSLSSEDDSESDTDEEHELLQALTVRLYEVDMNLLSEQTTKDVVATRDGDTSPKTPVSMLAWDERI